MNVSPPSVPALRREMSGLDGLFVTLAGLSPSIGVFIVGSHVIRMVGSGALLCLLAAVILGIARGDEPVIELGILSVVHLRSCKVAWASSPYCKDGL